MGQGMSQKEVIQHQLDAKPLTAELIKSRVFWRNMGCYDVDVKPGDIIIHRCEERMKECWAMALAYEEKYGSDHPYCQKVLAMIQVYEEMKELATKINRM